MNGDEEAERQFDYKVHSFALSIENSRELVERAKVEQIPKSELIAKAVLKYLEEKE
jgi:hypothetical protein